MRFRMMTVADIPAVFDVRLSTRENVITLDELRDIYGVTPESMAEGLATSLAGWVCEIDGRIVGFAMGDGESGEVLVVAVLPGYEGRGVGGGVLNRVRDWLFANGHAHIWLLASPDPDIRASGFYRNLGWRKTGEIRDDGEVLVLSR